MLVSTFSSLTHLYPKRQQNYEISHILKWDKKHFKVQLTEVDINLSYNTI